MNHTSPERHRQILKHLQRHRRATVAELGALTKVSDATIRRDLDQLEKEGRLMRAHGAALLPAPALDEPSYHARSRRLGPAKRAIAERARTLVQDQMHIYIDAGSTTLEVGRLLLDSPRVQITTNSLALATLALQTHRSVQLLGGEIRPVSEAVIGTLTLLWAEHLRFDLLFLGASGLDDTGLSTMEPREAEVKAAVMSRASRVVLLADLTKWQKPAPLLFTNWEAVDDWVADQPLPPRQRPKGVRFHSPKS